MRWAAVILVVLGLAAALSAALLVGALKAGALTSNLQESQEVNVLVASKEVASLTVLTAGDFTVKKMSRDNAPAGFVSEHTQAVGKVLLSPLVAGQPLTRKAFADRREGAALAARLRPGMRAVTITLHDAPGLSSLLYPGSRVDVLASFTMQGNTFTGNAVSTTLLQSVEVLALEGDTVVSDLAPDDPKNQENQAGLLTPTATKQTAKITPKRPNEVKVTLLVDLKQAEALQLAVERGTVSLALRNPLDTGTIEAEPMLLSQGRLAKLASFMPSAVPSTQPAHPSAAGTPPAAQSAQFADPPAAAVAAAPTPAALEPKKPQWELTIIRGIQSEIRTFELPEKARH